jgi:penicillin amidase
MGHSDPSVIHEVAIDCPTVKVAGINAPGVPAVVIGNTPHIAWGLTSGVADIEDVFFAKLVDDHSYEYGSETRKLEEFPREIKVKGSDPVTVNVVRTHHGPVILNSRVGKAVYSVASSFRNRELSGIASLIDLYNAQTGAQINTAIARVPVTFNLFYATTRGEYGYRYAGLVPYRARGVDPRFPTPSGPNTEWQGFVSSNQMPHATSFRSGLIANWNNKPVSWWPNFDTPVWGTPFRNQALLDAIPSGKLGRFDLERAAWQIARRDTETMGIFSEHFRDAVRSLAADDPLRRYIENFDGWYVEGSVGALLYDSAVEHLRTELFRPSVGTFLQPTIFETVIQPGTIKKALERRTKFDYLGERRAGEVVLAALRKAFDSLKESQGDDPSKWTFRPGSINVRGQRPIPYINRGTYIQITELSPVPTARSVASPGVAESGAHQYDQADLARAWTYKPMWPLK